MRFYRILRPSGMTTKKDCATIDRKICRFLYYSKQKFIFQRVENKCAILDFSAYMVYNKTKIIS